ncbi:MAG: type II toxin-antitoxin system RelB/DinJ family antitoxin [Clostridiales bacterium]|jgi:DNA-damage-inducible protein J|nr:type II toxin-antitoxin system RelB/DinJ family antitoxin [Clostridiales bacterium]
MNNLNATKSETLHIRIREGLKKDAESVLQDMGLSTSEAVNIFLAQVVNTNSIPFIIKTKIPNKETLEALQEAKDIASGKIKPNHKSIDELFEKIEKN